MESGSELADLQAALVELLASDLPVAEIAGRLAPRARTREVTEWIASFEAPMLETARELVIRWGRRAPRDP